MKEHCGAISGIFYCSRAGHKAGDHVARKDHQPRGRVLKRWPFEQDEAPGRAAYAADIERLKRLPADEARQAYAEVLHKIANAVEAKDWAAYHRLQARRLVHEEAELIRQIIEPNN